jgi:hypothetical protein
MKIFGLYPAESRSVAALFIVFTLLFVGCSLDGKPAAQQQEETISVTLDGTWMSDFGDGFVVKLNAETFEYDDGGGFGAGYDGTIEEIVRFNNRGTAGVIFIKYVNKPIRWDTEEEPEGDYIGIYFRNLTTTQGSFAVPFTEEDPIPAKASLEEAKNSFTEDKVGDYISYWAVYIKQ